MTTSGPTPEVYDLLPERQDESAGLTQEQAAVLREIMYYASETSLELPSNLSISTWGLIGQVLRKVRNSVEIWQGDWILFGEEHYGEHHAQYLEASDYTEGYLHNIAYVARNVRPENRVPGLSLSYYYEVAKCEPREQRALLSQAAPREPGEAPEMKRDEFRAMIREHVNRKAVESDADVEECPGCEGSGRCTHCGSGRCPVCFGVGEIPRKKRTNS